MRVPVRKRAGPLEFNLTPLIDVVFNLVIFFLVASHFARTEPAEAVSLPRASQGEEEETPRRLTVTVRPDGEYVVNSKTFSLDDIEQMIELQAATNPEAFALRIRGDRSAHYEFIEPLMLACARTGVKNFGFKVIQPE